MWVDTGWLKVDRMYDGGARSEAMDATGAFFERGRGATTGS